MSAIIPKCGVYSFLRPSNHKYAIRERTNKPSAFIQKSSPVVFSPSFVASVTASKTRSTSNSECIYSKTLNVSLFDNVFKSKTLILYLPFFNKSPISGNIPPSGSVVIKLACRCIRLVLIKANVLAAPESPRMAIFLFFCSLIGKRLLKREIFTCLLTIILFSGIGSSYFFISAGVAKRAKPYSSP